MRIAILGAPGSGKSKLARALATEHDLTLVDNYVQRLQKKTGLALGPWSSYSEHLMVAGHRLAEEYKVGFDKRITVSTIVDTLVYAAVKADVVMNQSQQAARDTYLGAQSAMQGLTLMYRETWDYDVAFWLPYTEEEAKERSGTWEAALNSAYDSAFDAFQAEVYTLLGTHKEKLSVVNQMLELVKGSDETPAPETD